MENYEFIGFEKIDDIGRLTIQRPKALNALNHQMLTELESFFSHLPGIGIRALILTGAGEKAFVAGADINEMKDFTGEEARALATRGQRVFQCIEDSPVPVIAAVNGFALGGGMELALSCDFIIASDKAQFGLPEVSLGIMPGYGGTQRLARNIGISKAKFMALTGDIYSAQKCYDWGLVAQVCPSDNLHEACEKIARTVASRAPKALGFVKKSISQGFNKSLGQGMEIEAEFFAKVFETKDKQEGVDSFLEKRKPKFQGE